MPPTNGQRSATAIAKARTGITGLDEVTAGGLPAGRPTLVCGGPGCGKSVLAIEFLVHGATQFDEPGLFVSFEERQEDFIANSQSFGFDLATLIEARRLKILHVDMSPELVAHTGEFSLDGLLIQIEQGLKHVGGTRLVLDGLETMLAALGSGPNLRTEVARLFHWIRLHRLSAIVTSERGKTDLTRYGFEEYISDCVIVLDHRLHDQISKRRLRIVKYRGSVHGTDEYPFLIGETGFSVLPITSLALDDRASRERVSSGIATLDAMLEGQGYFRGSSVLVSGKAGTGKTSLAAAFLASACARGERCLYLLTEESPSQVSRNLESLGISLDRYIETGLLTVEASRPTASGLEEQLMAILRVTDRIEPACVVIDPSTNFINAGMASEVKSMISRLMGYLKQRDITLVLTALTRGSDAPDETVERVSSLVDTWIVLHHEAQRYAHRHLLHVIKSRGMEHARDARELVMSRNGLSVRSLASETQS